MSLFINHTNHPSANWTLEQRQAAAAYGPIKDLPFPDIPPKSSEQQINEYTQKYLDQILALNPTAVLCQGEFTYTYGLVKLLKEHGISVLAACSERITNEEVKDNISRKISYFQFVQFREY